MVVVNNFLHSLLHLPQIAQPELSPNGKWVAWTWLNIAQAGDVYVAATDGSFGPTQLTDAGNTTWVASWLADSSGLIVAHDSDGDEKDQLFAVYLNKPKILEPLTDKGVSYYTRGGSIEHASKYLFYAANYDFDTKTNIEPFWLHRHEIASGKKVPIAKPQRSAYYVPQLSPDGSWVLYARSDNSPTAQQIWLAKTDGTTDQEIVNEGSKSFVKASWGADGQTIIVVADHGNYKRLGVYSLQSRSVRWLIDDPKRSIEHAFMPRLSKYIVVEEVKEARVFTVLLDPDTGKETPFPSFSEKETKVIGCSDDNSWICMQYAADQVEDIIRVDPESTTHVSLSHAWEKTALKPRDLVPAKSLHWKSDDGLDIQGWLFIPKIQVKGAILYIHGGPTGHSANRLNSEIQYYVSQGFVVLDPNYRGSTGFGLTFQEAIKAEGWGGAEQRDIAAGARALISSGLAQPGQIAITGSSYGGYSAWHAITHYPDLFAAAIPISGMVDLAADYALTRPDLRPYIESMMGGTPSELSDKFYERSPIHYLQNIQGDVLIVQGANDPNVTLESIRGTNIVLDNLGKHCELLVFENEGHGIQRPDNIEALLPRVIEFIYASFQRRLS